MISIATLKAMAAAGATLEVVIATLEEMSRDCHGTVTGLSLGQCVTCEVLREKARIRKQKQRSASRDSHGTSKSALFLKSKKEEDKKEKKERAAERKHALPDDWRPSNSLTLKGEEELAKMRDWARANAINKADWDATWRNWVRRAGGGCETVSPQLVVSNDGYAAFGSQEMEAWEAHERATGKSYPRDKRGGWTFPTRWPPQAARSDPLDERQPDARADSG